MSVKLLTEHHLEFLSLRGGCRGSSESTLVKMPHCWKSHARAHIFFVFICYHCTVIVESASAEEPKLSIRQNVTMEHGQSKVSVWFGPLEPNIRYHTICLSPWRSEQAYCLKKVNVTEVIHSSLASGKFYRLLITLANSLYPDQDQHYVGPGLDTNHLTL